MMGNIKPNVDIVVGMQYGSEAKGMVCQYLANYYNRAIRVGGSNAGHTIFLAVNDKTVEFKMRHIPATVLNKNCALGLAAGAIISPVVLEEELKMLAPYDLAVEDRLHIDPNALVIQNRHVAEEESKKEGSDMFDLIGSTREGVGAALAERVLRRGGVKLAYQEPYLKRFVDAVPIAASIDKDYWNGESVLLEGAQGCLLSNIHSPYYSYTTSRDTNASSIAAESGVPPHRIRNVIGVVRTYPIRVAGRSGPTGGREIEWVELSVRLGKKIEEFTTVTKRRRRIFEFSMSEFKYACLLNRPNILALTFANYLNPTDEGKTAFDELSVDTLKFIYDLEVNSGAKVLMVSTSNRTMAIHPSLAGYVGR